MEVYARYSLNHKWYNPWSNKSFYLVCNIFIIPLFIQCAEPGNIDSQIFEILNKLNSDLTVWKSISNKYDIDLFCGLFMEKGIEGLTIYPKALKALGERGIEIGFDIYGPD